MNPVQSLAIDTVLCTVEIDIWHTEKVQTCIFCNCHQNCSHSLHQGILTEYTVDNINILFENNDTRICHSDGTDTFTDKLLTFEK